MDAKEIQEKIDILQKEVSTVIKGKDEVIRKVIMAILASAVTSRKKVLFFSLCCWKMFRGLEKQRLRKHFPKHLDLQTNESSLHRIRCRVIL